jgi:branched-subunit amino acid transport protein
MSNPWVIIITTAAISATLKAVGPIIVSKKQLDDKHVAAVKLLGPCLLAAIVAIELFSNQSHLHINNQVLGVGLGGYIYLKKGNLIASIAIAVVVTALMRRFR